MKQGRFLSTFMVTTPPLSEHVTYLYDVLPRALRDVIRRTSLGHVVEGVLAFTVSGRFDATITVGVSATFGFGVINRIFRGRRTHVAKELYFDESSLESPIRRWLMRWAIRDIDVVVSNSRGEIPNLVDLLGLTSERFEFIPWPTDLVVQDRPEASRDYVFAGGRSFRDWKTLFAAVGGTGLRTVVVASAKDVADYRIPLEVELKVDIPYPEYVQLLRSARVVVIPLMPTFRSAGQIALLEAMTFGKPIIATRALGLTHPITHNFKCMA